MRTTHRQHEQDRVQADERRHPARRSSETGSRGRDHRHGGEARGDRDGLQRPQTTGDPQRRGRIACEREQGAVGRVLEGPPDERKDRVGGRLGSHMGVRIEAVQRAHARKREVPEHVLGDQRRPEQQDHVRQQHTREQRPHRQRARGHEHEHVARAHQQRERLKAMAAEPDIETPQRARQPRGPPAAAGRHVLSRPRRGAGAQQERRSEHAKHAKRSKRAQDACGHPRARRPVGLLTRPAGEPDTGDGGRGLYAPNCCAYPTRKRPTRPLACSCATSAGLSTASSHVRPRAPACAGTTSFHATS